MQNRKYVLSVSVIAVSLLILAFVRPNYTACVSQATITVPKKPGPHGLNVVTDHIQSLSFLRLAGRQHGLAEGIPSECVPGILDRWAARVQTALVLTEKDHTADDLTDIVLEYEGSNRCQSLDVMNAVLAALALESERPRNEADVRAQIQAEAQRHRQALASFVSQTLARMREQHRDMSGEQQISISTEQRVYPDGSRRLHSSGESEAPQFDQGHRLTDRHSANETGTEVQKVPPWPQKQTDRPSPKTLNPEFDVLNRALVKAQAERKDLLARYAANHAAVRRVDLEIGELQLLISRTEKYLEDHAVGVAADGADPSAAVADSEADRGWEEKYIASFDEQAAISLIHQSETYQKLSDQVERAQNQLRQLSTLDLAIQDTQQIVVSRPPELLKTPIKSLPFSRLISIVTIASLIGFVLSRLGDSVSLPAEFYSIADVYRSLKIPVIGQLAMDNTPAIPQPERVASVGVWQFSVRAVELLAVFLIGTFAIMAVTHPSILREISNNPVTAYLHALDEFRNQFPMPYLFN